MGEGPPVIVEEIRAAYATIGIALERPVAYGTYYRLGCAGCGAGLGTVGDRLLPAMAGALVDAHRDLYATGLLGCACGHQRERAGVPAAGGRPVAPLGAAPVAPDDAEAGWPLWRAAYAAGDPLPVLDGAGPAAPYRFEAGEPLPDEYRALLVKMLRHEGERAGNKSFLGFMATCLDLAEAFFPPAARRLKSEYLAEELRHAILFHRLAVGLDPDFALRDVPYAHYTFHLPRESWADDALFHFLVDLNGAFHARDWRTSSYLPLRRLAVGVERDELGHSEMGRHFLAEICAEGRGRALVQRRLATWYPAALDMFGRSDSRNAPRFLHWGLKRVGNAEIRQAYQAYVDARLEALGLDPPDPGRNRRFL